MLYTVSVSVTIPPDPSCTAIYGNNPSYCPSNVVTATGQPYFGIGIVVTLLGFVTGVIGYFIDNEESYSHGDFYRRPEPVPTRPTPIREQRTKECPSCKAPLPLSANFRMNECPYCHHSLPTDFYGVTPVINPSSFSLNTNHSTATYVGNLTLEPESSTIWTGGLSAGLSVSTTIRFESDGSFNPKDLAVEGLPDDSKFHWNQNPIKAVVSQDGATLVIEITRRTDPGIYHIMIKFRESENRFVAGTFDLRVER